MTTKAYHNAAPPEYNEKDQPPPIRRWRPGEPIPPANSGIDPDPYEALARSAAAYERELERRRFTERRPADRRAA